MMAWDSHIIGHIKCGNLQHALAVYEKIQKDNTLYPCEHTFVALFKACAKLKDIAKGIQIHAYAANLGLVSESLPVGNALIYMYAKCGVQERAQLVFDVLEVPDVVSWTTLIGGYAEHGQNEEALKCFEQMHLQGVCPNSVTFVCSLKACSDIRTIRKGMKIHAEIESLKLLEREVTVGTALVDMYAKCGLLSKSREVFDNIGNRDVILWNTIITGFIEHGHAEEALKHFMQMQLEGVFPDSVTFVSSLKACISIGEICKRQLIQVEIERNGLLIRDKLFSNSLVDIYVKWGKLCEAQEIFDKLPDRDAITWNILITGYIKYQYEEKVLECFELMQLQGIFPTAVTYVYCLKTCGSIKARNKGQELHAKVEEQGFLQGNLVLGNAVIDMYVNCQLLDKAYHAFEKFVTRDVVTWTTVIAGYAEHGYGEKAINLFEQMQLESIVPNAITFISVLKACSIIGNADKCHYVHDEIKKHGLIEHDHVLSTMLVDTYAKCSSFSKAHEVFDKIPYRDVALWNTLMSGCVEEGRPEEALQCFDQMQCHGVSPNEATFITAMKACYSVDSIDKMMELHTDIERLGLLKRCSIIGSSLVGMYSKCGHLTNARHVFDNLLIRDKIAWTTLMGGYAQVGQSENALETFDRMRLEGIRPDSITFIVVISACSHTGLINKGYSYFEVMNKDFGIAPTIEHQVCMITLLGRVGKIEQAVALFGKLLCCRNLAVWRTVLNICRNWGNLDFGKKVFERAIHLETKDAVSYVLLSHIYASSIT